MQWLGKKGLREIKEKGDDMTWGESEGGREKRGRRKGREKRRPVHTPSSIFSLWWLQILNEGHVLTGEMVSDSQGHEEAYGSQTYTHTHTYTYTHTNTHTNIHTHTHTYFFLNLSRLNDCNNHIQHTH